MQALNSVERGLSDDPVIVRPTEDDTLGVGVAMALIVKRDGVLRTHVVLGPQIIRWIRQQDEDGYLNVLRILSHELGHVLDHALKARAFGDYALRTIDEIIPNRLECYLWELSNHCWDEYFANRVSSALFLRGKWESELFTRTFEAFPGRRAKARSAYRDNEITLDEFLAGLKHDIGLLLRSAGYLMGALDEQDDEESVLKGAAQLLQSPSAASLRAFHVELRTIWERRECWESYGELLRLNRPMLDLLHSLEIYPSLVESGIHFDIPVKL